MSCLLRLFLQWTLCFQVCGLLIPHNYINSIPSVSFSSNRRVESIIFSTHIGATAHSFTCTDVNSNNIRTLKSHRSARYSCSKEGVQQPSASPFIKILCLHGYLSNSLIFETQLREIINKTSDFCDYGKYLIICVCLGWIK